MTVYTLFGQGAASNTTAADNFVTLGMQFTLSQNASLTGIWFYSPSGVTLLPAQCGVFQMTGAGTGTLVASDTSPAWSGAAGSGWVKCTFGGTVTLTASTVYKTCVQLGSTLGNYYGFTSNYWTSGAGGSGQSSGIITAPNNAGADGGQDTFTGSVSVLTYPASSFNATNYWIDVEVTTSTAAPVPYLSQNSGMF